MQVMSYEIGFQIALPFPRKIHGVIPRLSAPFEIQMCDSFSCTHSLILFAAIFLCVIKVPVYEVQSILKVYLEVFTPKICPK